MPTIDQLSAAPQAIAPADYLIVDQSVSGTFITSRTTVGAVVGPSGTTAQRPAGAPNGMPFFDTTLGYPVWALSTSGTGWVNASGAPA